MFLQSSCARDIADRSTEVSKHYHKGKAASKVKLLHQEMQLAYVGSPLALENAQKNLMDVEDETAVPYHMIVVQPFFPTTDPRVVGINPVPNIDERIKKLTKELGASNPDTLNIVYEEADMNFEEIFD